MTRVRTHENTSLVLRFGFWGCGCAIIFFATLSRKIHNIRPKIKKKNDNTKINFRLNELCKIPDEHNKIKSTVQRIKINVRINCFLNIFFVKIMSTIVDRTNIIIVTMPWFSLSPLELHTTLI